jgi:RNA polymerase sigma-70 factor (ECF subfamily)
MKNLAHSASLHAGENNAPSNPGIKHRKRERKASVSQVPGPMPSLDEVPAMASVASVGYGSPEAIEAACDARLMWAWATPPLRVILGGLLEGKAQVDIAAEMNLDRFKVARMIKTLHEFAAAA